MRDTDAVPAKPLPPADGLAREFYKWCGRGELRFQRCLACNPWRHPPREMCPGCGAWEWEWDKAAGHGRVFSWTVATRALHPAFKSEVPYAAVVVEMDEGVRLLSWVLDCLPDELTIDVPVEVVFERVAEEVTLPYFRRAHHPNGGKE
ncbi:MAG TPA: OB-fold domain-containing protein [Dehalococcoidia bacterium]|nr:OB-fold domain-containing protein [Dehalococcoidia bacterium]